MNKENVDKNSGISERLSKVLEYLKETRNSFAMKLGYERAQTVYDILNGKSAPSYDFFKKFLISEYSDSISLDWLITGRGEMLISPIKEVASYTLAEPSIAWGRENDSLLYKMYKEKDAEAGALKEENGRLKERIRILEEKAKELLLVPQSGSTTEKPILPSSGKSNYPADSATAPSGIE